MKKIIKKSQRLTFLTTSTLSVFLLSNIAFAQEQAVPPPFPAAKAVPANPPEDNKAPSPAEEKVEAQALQTKRNALLKEGIIKPSDLPENQNPPASVQNTPLKMAQAEPPQDEVSPPSLKNEKTKLFSPLDVIKNQQALLQKQQTMILALTQEKAQQTSKLKEAEISPNQTKDSLFFNEADNPKLNADEITAISKQKAWNTETSVKPLIGKNGVVEFTYGTQIPSILCAPMQVTDLQLQQGEKILNINIGDAARWKIDPALTGGGDNATQHLMIKPLENGLQTSLAITTDKRTYHLALKSHLTKFMPYVTFFYADEAQALIQARLEKQKAAEIKEKSDNTIPETGEYLGNLDFHYCIKGNAPWKPLRIYNDTHKTMIDLPDSVKNSVAPTLLINEPYSKTPGLVNSRLVNNRFIVDQIFDKAQLIVGVGKYQKKITIRKGVC